MCQPPCPNCMQGPAVLALSLSVSGGLMLCRSLCTAAALGSCLWGATFLQCKGNGIWYQPPQGQDVCLMIPPSSTCAAGPGESAQQDGDASILRDLFEGTGIMGAMDHAKIEGANDPEARTADLAAAKVAKRAADELRKSRAARQVCAAVSSCIWHYVSRHLPCRLLQSTQ